MISIIIPTFRPSSYLEACINSLEKQTLSFLEFEIIIILNGDRFPYEMNIKNIIRNKNINITYLYTSNPGVSNARNIGIDNSKGNFLYFLDDDDILSPNHLEDIQKIAAFNTIVASNVYSFYEDINEKLKDYLTYKGIKGNIIQNRKYLSNSCCKLIPRNIIGNNRFNIHFCNGEDALFMFSISDKIERIVVEPNSIYYRRLRPNSASRTKISFWERMVRVFRQQIEYTKIYFSNPLKYNFILFLTRLIAVYKQ